MNSYSRPKLCSFKNSSKSGVVRTPKTENPVFLRPMHSYHALEICGGDVVSLSHLCEQLINLIISYTLKFISLSVFRNFFTVYYLRFYADRIFMIMHVKFYNYISFTSIFLLMYSELFKFLLNILLQ